MGLTTQYLRYVPGATFGVIGSVSAGVTFVRLRGTLGRFLATAACQDVVVWDTKTLQKVLTLKGGKSEVTVIVQNPVREMLAVGYADGTIQIFQMESVENPLTLHGHKSAVSCLAFDQSGMRLASGSKDTEVVLWDIVNEAGMFRMKGHKGMVTSCSFLKENILITSSKDTFVKFWDLDTQHCFKTLVGHRTEVWDFVLIRNGSQLITGTSDDKLHVWSITFKEKDELKTSEVLHRDESTTLDKPEGDEGEDEDDDSALLCKLIGSLQRQGKGRVTSVHVDKQERLLGCHGTDSSLEIFKILSDEELKKRMQKKQRKRRKQLQKSEDSEQLVEDIEVELKVSDGITPLPVVTASGKVKSFDMILENAEVAKVAVLLHNNSIDLHKVALSEKAPETTLVSAVKLPGHRSDVRTVAFSSDGVAIVSASKESLKIWNRSSQQCIRTMECEYALSSTFAPGDRHCIVGTKTGKLQIFDVAAGILLENVEAHAGAVWTICMLPSGHGLVSGSEDKEVRFWDFDLVKDQNYSETSKRLSLSHTRSLKMSEDVLCVRLSPDERLLAVSLLDSTVKVFFVDTLKFFLSLYGHKFPVLCMDISHDSTLIVTGSADRNVKIWGLDFGDCHKSIFAHEDSVMCLQFVPKTHQFFTGGKDKKLNQWDADNFQKVVTLEGHQGEIWALDISPNGKHVVTASHDRSLRLWEQTQEPLVLEEEQELEREAEYEKGAASAEEPVVPGETNKEAGLASRSTVETIKAAERLMEALKVYEEESKKQKEHKLECETLQREVPAPAPHPLMVAMDTTCPARYMLEVLRKVKSSELEEALLVLPFDYVANLLHVIEVLLEKGWETELVCRCLFFLLRIHCNQVMSNHTLLPVIDKLRTLAVTRVSQLRDIIGFNLAGLRHLQREIDSQDEVALFTDATSKYQKKRRKHQKNERTVITI